MAKSASRGSVSLSDCLPFGERHYKELWRRQLVRLLLLYLGPLLVVTAYFTVQYSQLASNSRRLHLQEIADNQANTLNLFLLERVANIENLIDDPGLLPGAASPNLEAHLESLARINETFVDLGYVDASGVQAGYAGPFPSLANRNYSSEPWYERLIESEKSHIVTDSYLGFRREPHFTVGVKRAVEDRIVVLRATLDPERIYQYMRSLKGAAEVSISIVNREGYYQLVTPDIGAPLEASSVVPPTAPGSGAERVRIGGLPFTYAYSWLQIADWVLIVQPSSDPVATTFTEVPGKITLIAVPITALVVLIVLARVRKLVDLQKETDRTRAQLEHAAKLASVGELAAGIAHEINNPLAVINEEAGLLKDLMNPALSEPPEVGELVPYLDSIQESVFRCRDITQKLLTFVRRTDVEMQKHDLHRVIDGVVDGLLGREWVLSDIDVVREYRTALPQLLTDRNQLQQVLLNILNNAVDALDGKPGQLVIRTGMSGKRLRVAITDTGTGMTQEQLEKIFLPFYTTKEVGKGNGLGLSVSYGIMKDLGGEIEVESTVGVGSTFTVILPLQREDAEDSAAAVEGS